MRRIVLTIALAGFIMGCGPDPEELVKAENKKLSDMTAIESVRIEEAMNRIRAESDQIARGGSVDVTTTAANILPDTSNSVSQPRPQPQLDPEPTSISFPHHIQLGAFTSEQAAASHAAQWEQNGFTNVTFFENPNATTAYRYVVRLTGYSGYRATLLESERINRQYDVKTFPIQIRN